jgi:hypothetical protein
MWNTECSVQSKQVTANWAQLAELRNLKTQLSQLQCGTIKEGRSIEEKTPVVRAMMVGLVIAKIRKEGVKCTRIYFQKLIFRD